MIDQEPFNTPARASLECQILVLTSSSERDFNQLDSPYEDAKKAGNDVPPGTVTGMRLQRRQDPWHT